MLELAQPQLQKWARCSAAVFPKMFTFREKLSQVSPIPEDYNVTPPPPRIASPPRVTTVYNKRTGGGGCWCVSIRAHSLSGPSFMHVWSSVCCLFLHLPSPPVRFIGQLHAVHEMEATMNPLKDLTYTPLECGEIGPVWWHTSVIPATHEVEIRRAEGMTQV
jgi:hypothetical protein